ncbi:unnamed protein product, partial [Rotaria sp. Silwood2]
MKKFLFLLVVCLLISISESNRRRRQYHHAQQYANQYGLYGPGGQGWVNNNNNRYPNSNYAW